MNIKKKVIMKRHYQSTFVVIFRRHPPMANRNASVDKVAEDSLTGLTGPSGEEEIPKVFTKSEPLFLETISVLT